MAYAETRLDGHPGAVNQQSTLSREVRLGSERNRGRRVAVCHPLAIDQSGICLEIALWSGLSAACKGGVSRFTRLLTSGTVFCTT